MDANQLKEVDEVDELTYFEATTLKGNLSCKMKKNLLNVTPKKQGDFDSGEYFRNRELSDYAESKSQKKKSEDCKPTDSPSSKSTKPGSDESDKILTLDTLLEEASSNPQRVEEFDSQTYFKLLESLSSKVERGEISEEEQTRQIREYAQKTGSTLFLRKNSGKSKENSPLKKPLKKSLSHIH